MIPLNEYDPPQSRNRVYISPGVVGSVGDVNVAPRLKRSCPDLDVRFDPYFSGRNAAFLGSNVQNGNSTSYCSGGDFGPMTRDSRLLRTRQRTNVGWEWQDLRAPDTFHEPRNAGTPQYSWHNKIATAYEAKRTGGMFLPVPGEYYLHPSQTPRGGAVPRIVNVEEEEEAADLANKSVVAGRKKI